jgi:uncharacterized protein (DUF427 family)
MDADEARRERDRWRNFPRQRPRHVETPGPGQESVWDYPRPPRVEPERRIVRIEFAGEVIAESDRALRVLETSSPPTLYVPDADLRSDLLVANDRETLCEWKGLACYWSLVLGDRGSPNAAWGYPDPDPHYAELLGHRAFFPGRVDACFLGGEPVRAQTGGFYGGWITSDLAGPFKGAPGSEAW